MKKTEAQDALCDFLVELIRTNPEAFKNLTVHWGWTKLRRLSLALSKLGHEPEAEVVMAWSVLIADLVAKAAQVKRG